MFAIMYRTIYNNNWSYCIENGEILTFESKDMAQMRMAEIAEVTSYLKLNHQYKVVRYDNV